MSTLENNMLVIKAHIKALSSYHNVDDALIDQLVKDHDTHASDNVLHSFQTDAVLQAYQGAISVRIKDLCIALGISVRMLDDQANEILVASVG